jgi:hypothetical protein
MEHALNVEFKRKFIIIFFLLTSLAIHAQVKDIPPILSGKNSIDEILRIGIGGYKQNYSVCNYSFKVTDKGIIDTVYVLGNCNNHINNSIVGQIKKTNGNWKARTLNGKPVTSKLFTLTYFLIQDYSEQLRDNNVRTMLEVMYKQQNSFFEVNSSLTPQRIDPNKFFETKDKYIYPPGWLEIVK